MSFTNFSFRSIIGKFRAFGQRGKDENKIWINIRVGEKKSWEMLLPSYDFARRYERVFNRIAYSINTWRIFSKNHYSVGRRLISNVDFLLRSLSELGF